MRFRKLSLERYGRFTGKVLDFGTATGNADLHIVYGPNEAGKSTTMSAMLDLLFGIETQSTYSFLHPYSTMRIGAVLEFADGSKTFARIKRPQNSLLDEADQPVHDSILQSTLGGINRETYRAMFSLDDETLEEGGNSILASQGDLGQLLFSASAGLANFSKSLLALKQEADAFFKVRSRTSELGLLKERLADLIRQRDLIDLRAHDYAKLVRQRDQAEADYQAHTSARAEIDLRIDELGRQLTVLPLMTERADLLARIEPLAHFVEVPDDRMRDVRILQNQLIELNAQLGAKADRIATLAQSVELADPDEPALTMEDQLDRISDFAARHVTAEIDIPKLQAQLAEENRSIDAILHRLSRADCTDPQVLVLPISRMANLRQLIEQRPVLDVSFAAAEVELAAANRVLEEFESDPGSAPDLGDVSALTAEIAVLRRVDPERQIETRKTELAKAQAALNAGLKDLLPWTGDVDALARLPVPLPGERQKWAASLKECELQTVVARNDEERAKAEIARLEAEIAVLAKVVGSTDVFSAARIRAERDRAWAVHLQNLDPQSAGDFENLMRLDDQASQLQLTHANDLARLTTLNAQLAVNRADAEIARQKCITIGVEQSRIEAEIARFWARISPVSEMPVTLERLELWLANRETVLQCAAGLADISIDVDAAKADLERLRKRMTQAMGEAGLAYPPNADLNALAHLALRAQERHAEQKARREKKTEAERNHAHRLQEFEKASAERAEWAEHWQLACRDTWFSPEGVVPDIIAVREILNLLDQLAPRLENRRKLVDRVEKMQLDQSSFQAAVQELANVLGLESSDPARLWKTINRRVTEAQNARDQLLRKRAELDGEQNALRQMQEALAVLEAKKRRYLAEIEVESLDDAIVALEALARRREYKNRLAGLEKQVLSILRADTIHAAEDLIATLDRAGTERDLAEYSAKKGDADQRMQELYAVLVKAQDELAAVGGDAEVARLDEARRTVLLDIEDRAQRYIRLRAGILAAELALRTYRDLHRSAMMQRASDAFALVSRGAYTGLSTQPEKDSETLIALSRDGGSKVAKDMSKGTRFQLYLALRVAGYHEFARTRATVPFIADDIMETFDDFRAEETFRLFADMANVGQVIYFTHHRHLCDIARTVCPQVTIHEL